MKKIYVAFLSASAAALAAAVPALSAEVTPQRLTNPEAGNWLMNHRTYDGQDRKSTRLNSSH